MAASRGEPVGDGAGGGALESRAVWGAGLRRRALEVDEEAEVCVVGAGMAGVLCALALARAGKRVVVVEAAAIGGGESGRTTAHLSNAVDDRYSRLIGKHGAEVARINARAHSAAIDHLERVAEEEGIDCDFARVDGYLFLPPGEELDVLARELRATREAGLEGVEMVESAPGLASGPALRFPRQGQFHPMRFLSGAASAAERLGVRIYTDSRVTAVEKGPPLRVRVQGGASVSALRVIVATNSPVNDRLAIHTKQGAYRTYAVTLRVDRGSTPAALWWDTSEAAGDEGGPYHYVRLAGPHATAEAGLDPERDDLLVVGGEDHPTGEEHGPTAARWNKLESWARQRWSGLGEVVGRWSGQVLEPHDLMAFIGADPKGPEGVFVVTGDSGMGMTHSAIAALLLPALIEGAGHAWAEVFDPSRKPVRALGEFTSENARIAVKYADWLRGGEEEREIPRGEGRIVRHGLRLLAVYRDDTGELHRRSAVCPHLGCVVRWNRVEKSWDCPCHGSRFDAGGRVLNGPAFTDLGPPPEGTARRGGSGAARRPRPT